MADGFQRFVEDKRGTTFEGIALSVAVIAVAFVASADMLDFMVKKHADTSMVASTNSSNLDYTPTASLPKMISRSVLDPCTGATK